MKNTIKIFLLILTINITSVNAQYVIKGTNLLSAGIGIGSSFGSYTHSSSSPGISIIYEKGIWNVDGPGVISLGGYLGFKSYRYVRYGYTEKWNYTVLGFRGAYHYNGLQNEDSDFLKKLDLYGGLMLSFNYLRYSNNFPSGYDNRNDYNSGLGATLFVGGRYFVTDKFAIYTELGYGVSYLNIGGTLKF